MSNTVALILDPDFGEKLTALDPHMPVWIVASPLNDRAVTALRQQYGDARLTTFLRRPNESAADTLARALIAIDEHHGDESAEVPYETIEVYGSQMLPSAALRTELGFRSVNATNFGFKAEK